MGFLAGWGIILDYVLTPTLLYVFAAVTMNTILPGVAQWIWVIVFVVLNTGANLLGIRITKRVNLIFLAGEIVVLAIFTVSAASAISRGVNGAHWTLLPFFNHAEFSPSLIFAALSVAVLSFTGFDAISTQAEEVKGGNRTVGRATVLALVLAAALFMLQTYLAALLVPGFQPFEGEQAENQAFYMVAKTAGGPWLALLCSVAVALAIVACSMVAQTATSRLLYAMARDGDLPRFLNHVSERAQVPDRAIVRAHMAGNRPGDNSCAQS